MKRNCLLAKSLALGLAVATAAASMSVPGGLVAPVTAYAETGVAAQTDAVSISGTAKAGAKLTATLATDNADAVFAWYRVSAETKDANVELPESALPVTDKEYELTKDDIGSKILVVVKSGSADDAAETGRALSEVVETEALPDGSVIKYNGAELDANGYNDAVEITAEVSSDDSAAYFVADTVQGLQSSPESYTLAKPDADNAACKKMLYFKLASADDIYQKEITVAFDVTAPTLSDIADPTEITSEGATLSVTSSEAGNVYYHHVAEGTQAPDAAAIVAQDTKVAVTADTAATINLTGLDAYKQYDVYAVAKDAGGNCSAVKKVSFTTKKSACTTTAPVAGTFTADGRKLTFTVVDDKAAKDYDYSLDAGDHWTNGAANGSILTISGTTATLTLPNQVYDANVVCLRVAETDTEEAGEKVVYGQKISATLEGTVTVSGTEKFGETITATVTGAQDGAELKYEFVRVKDNNSPESCGTASTANTYTLVQADIGCTIKVKVSADGYTGEFESSNATGVIAKADGRAITVEDVKAEIQTPADGVETYTYTMKTQAGAKYQKTDGAGSQPAEGAWGDTKEFTNLTPGQSYTFHAYMPATEEYEAGAPVSFTIAFPKLKHTPLTLAYTVTDSGDKKKVTITVPAGGGSYEYTFDGETWSSAGEANVKDECEAEAELTIGIRYKADDAYESQLEQTLKIVAGKDPQTAPSPATLQAQPNAAKTAYDIEVTEPSVGAGTLEYSTDGNTFKPLAEIQTEGLAAGTTYTLYVRLAGDDTKNPSGMASATVTTPAASAKPAVTGAGDATTFTDSLEVTLAAAAGASIYYTADGSAPTLDSTLYAGPITLSETKTIKAIAVETGKIMSAVASQTFTKGSSGGSDSGSGSGSGNGSGSSSSGSGSTGTENKPGTGIQTKPDDTKVETSTETNASGNTVEVTTTTKTDSTGAVTSIVEKSVIAESSSTTSTTVTVKKNGEGEITSAAASISNTVASGNKATVSAALVSQITEAAGTDDVKITMTVRDADGNTKYKLKVDAEDLKAGEDLYLYKLNTKTGEYVMVDAKTYGVSKSGSVAVSIKNKATYELVDYAQSAKITNEIKSTIKPQKSSVSVKKNKNTTFALSKKANKSNIKSITYTTSKKSVATVSKSGKISAKGKGTATVKAKVTLKNGATKTIKMTIKVK